MGCSQPVWPSMIMPMLYSMSPPSAVTRRPRSRAASVTHCRWSRRGCRYSLIITAPHDARRATFWSATSRLVISFWRAPSPEYTGSPVL